MSSACIPLHCIQPVKRGGTAHFSSSATINILAFPPDVMDRSSGSLSTGEMSPEAHLQGTELAEAPDLELLGECRN